MIIKYHRMIDDTTTVHFIGEMVEKSTLLECARAYAEQFIDARVRSGDNARMNQACTSVFVPGYVHPPIGAIEQKD